MKEDTLLGAVIGNYQIVRKLGEGGMGAVYLGQHQLLGRRAAIKVLLPELSARPDIVNRFFNEARAVTSISDPGIVQVFDFGYHSDGAAFIVMEFLEGEPLDRRLARMGRLPAAEALRLCRQIAGSLAAAHAQNIIHRDLKPENIYLVRDSEVASGERSKILDFGIAKLSDSHPGKIKTSTGALMGTPVYMSPEQCRGLSELDHRSDIYSLGCVLFHLLTGRPPFDGEGMGDIIAAHIREPAPAPSSRAPDIAPSVDALVIRCLAKPPAERYQTMHELAAAIGQILPYITSPGAPTQWAHGYAGGATPPPYGAPPGTPLPYGAAPGHSPPGTPVPPPYGAAPGHASPGTPVPPPYGAAPGHASPGTPVPPYGAAPGPAATVPLGHGGPPGHSSPGTPVASPYGAAQAPAATVPLIHGRAAGHSSPGSPVPPGHAGAATAPAGSPAPLRATPTTLSAGAAQVASAPPVAPAPRSRVLGWAIAGLLVLGGAGAAVAITALRGGGAGQSSRDPAAIPAPVAAGAGGSALAVDAGAVVVTPVDAAPDAVAVDAAIPIDAAPAIDAAIDAAPRDAAALPSKPHVPHGGSPRAGSAVRSPPGCDRSVDTDCDGIPDVR